jgi:hypothetical protein
MKFRLGHFEIAHHDLAIIAESMGVSVDNQQTEDPKNIDDEYEPPAIQLDLGLLAGAVVAENGVLKKYTDTDAETSISTDMTDKAMKRQLFFQPIPKEENNDDSVNNGENRKKIDPEPVKKSM